VAQKAKAIVIVTEELSRRPDAVGVDVEDAGSAIAWLPWHLATMPERWPRRNRPNRLLTLPRAYSVRRRLAFAAVPEPLIVEVRRNGVLEAVHRVHAVAVRDGAVVAEAGDASLTCFMRSSSKPLQALPLVRARDDLSQAQIAIACASHRATPAQLAAAQSLLDLAGCTEDDLELGLQEGREPRKLANNCSGKHAGMLALCRAHGWPTRGYREPEHQVQQACAAAHAEAAHVDQSEFKTGNDGCGVVTFAMPLERMAFAFSNLPALANADRIAAAMRAHPELVGGEDGADVLLMRAAGRELVAKGGAEGLLCAVDQTDNTGYVLKSEDGASRPLAAAAAAFIGVELPPTIVRNTRNEIVGEVSLQSGDT
jgi:L-asparaginase II